MAAGWKRFDLTAVIKAMDSAQPNRIFVIRRPNGKCNIGSIDSIGPDGVTLTNGVWRYLAEFTDGPMKMFFVIDPPQTDIIIGDKPLL